MDTAHALALPAYTRYTSPAYTSPVLAWRGETAEREHIVWWVVVVGFSYAAALAWSSYCIYKGGSPSISFGWSGFKVTCLR